MKEGDRALNALHRRGVDQLNSCASKALQLCINVSDFKAEVMKPFTFRREEARDSTGTVRRCYELNLRVTRGEEGDPHFLRRDINDLL